MVSGMRTAVTPWLAVPVGAAAEAAARAAAAANRTAWEEQLAAAGG